MYVAPSGGCSRVAVSRAACRIPALILSLYGTTIVIRSWGANSELIDILVSFRLSTEESWKPHTNASSYPSLKREGIWDASIIASQDAFSSVLHFRNRKPAGSAALVLGKGFACCHLSCSSGFGLLARKLLSRIKYATVSASFSTPASLTVLQSRTSRTVSFEAASEMTF